MRRDHRRHNYLFSIIRTMLLCGIIPLLILGVLSYKISSNALQKKVAETNMLLLQQTRMRFEQTLDIIYNYYVLLGNDSDISDQLDNSLSYSDVTIIPEIQTKLHELQNLQNIVNGSKLVNLQNNWVIFHDYFRDHIDRDLREYTESRMTRPQNVFWTFEEKRNNQISLFIKLPYNSSSNTAAIIVDLNLKEIHKYFPDDGEKTMLVTDDGGSIVHYHDEGLTGHGAQEILGPDYRTKLSGNRGTFVFKDGSGNSQYVIYEKSDYNGWTYFILYDIHGLNKEIINIRNLTLLMIVLLILALSIIIIFWSSKRLYSPVGTLLEEKQMLQIEMARQSTQIEELFLRKLIRSELSGQKIKERTASIGKLCDYAGYYIVSIGIKEIGDKGKIGKDEELAAILLLNAIRDEQEESRYLTPILKNGIIVSLIDSGEEDFSCFREQLFLMLVRLQANIGMQLDLEIAAGISQVHRDPLEAEIAFKESIEALMSNGGGDKETPIRFFEDITPGKVINIVYPTAREEELIQWINNGNSEKAAEVTEEMIDHIFSTHVGYSEQMLHVSRLLIKLTNVLLDSGIPLSEIFEKSENPMDLVMALTNRNDIKSWFRSRLIEPMIPLLRKQRSSRNKTLIRDIKRMIEEKYDQDISLEECAYELDYHPSYIWRVMKQEMGVGFTEYLLDYRLQKARELLIGTDDSIGDIAQKLCYNNTQNFIRYFKKREGVTPGIYRKENQI